MGVALRVAHMPRQRNVEAKDRGFWVGLGRNLRTSGLGKAAEGGVADVWGRERLGGYDWGEGQLEEALVSRVNQLRRAGGVRALKGLLRMGCRAPLYAPERAELEGLPPPERPV